MKLMLFDIDGTLLLSGGAGTRALNRAFLEEVGVAEAMEGITCGGKTDPWIVDEVLERHAPDRRGEPGLPGRVITRYLEHLERELPLSREFRLMPHARECVEALAARPDVALAVATGNVERGAALKLARARLHTHFPVGGYGSDHAHRSELLKTAWRRAEHHYRRPFPRDSVWVVGDTPLDVSAARDAGFYAVGVGAHAWDAAALRACGADRAVADLGGVLEALVAGP